MEYQDVIGIFISIIYEALPFIVIGVILAGLLGEFVPQQAIAKLIPANPLLGIMLGALLGVIFPMCECGIIVVMRRLLRKGLPLSVSVSYVLCGPIVNAVVLTSTWVAFSRSTFLGGPWGMVVLRGGLGYVVAVVTALIVEWQYRKHGMKLLSPRVTRGLKDPQLADDAPAAKRTAFQRIDSITQTALNDFVDIMVFLIIGAAIASGFRILLSPPREAAPAQVAQAAGAQNAVVNPQIPFEVFVANNPAIAILMLMSLAVLFCLCSEADAFVAANFQLFWPPAAKLAFLVLGPMFDLKLCVMYTRVFRTRLIVTIFASVTIQVFVYCLVVDYIWRNF